MILARFLIQGAAKTITNAYICRNMVCQDSVKKNSADASSVLGSRASMWVVSQGLADCDELKACQDVTGPVKTFACRAMYACLTVVHCQDMPEVRLKA